MFGQLTAYTPTPKRPNRQSHYIVLTEPIVKLLYLEVNVIRLVNKYYSTFKDAEAKESVVAVI